MIRSVYYGLLDLITLKKGIKVRINNFEIRLPARYHKYFPKDYEKENFEFFQEHAKPGMTIIDIGAHFGVFSVYFQKITNGKVYAFEPTKSTFKVLNNTIRINKCSNKVFPYQEAIDNHSGTATFFISESIGGRGNTLVADSELGGTNKSYEVPVTSIDLFTAQKGIKVDFLKIDAEGAELGVLKGAEQTIKNDRPFILLSIHPEPIQSRGDTLKEIWDILMKYRYNILLEDRTLTENEFCSTQSLFDLQLLPL
ncbi:MAG: FkbM family methyltransferase [Calditrichaeota bacterium]|nr:FkbM family methyltransferase [Calditrichota bacterium]